MNAAKKDSAPRLITCIVPKGDALAALKALMQEHGQLRAQMHLARGTATSSPKALKGLVEHAEKEMLELVCEHDEADAMFAWLYTTLRIGEPHRGIMYMQRLARATGFRLPEIEENPAPEPDRNTESGRD